MKKLARATLISSVLLTFRMVSFADSAAASADTSLPALLLAPFTGNEVVLSANLWTDVTAYIAQLPVNEQPQILQATEIKGDAFDIRTGQRSIQAKGMPKGLVLKLIAELHGATMSFDGKVVSLRFLGGTSSTTTARWYPISSSLVEAFSPKPSDSPDSDQNTSVKTAMAAILANDAGLFREVRLGDVDTVGLRLRLSSEASTLDALDRWLTIELAKIIAQPPHIGSSETKPKTSEPSDAKPTPAKP